LHKSGSPFPVFWVISRGLKVKIDIYAGTNLFLLTFGQARQFTRLCSRRHHRPHLDRAHFRRWNARRDGFRFILVAAVYQDVAGQLLLGLGKRAVDHRCFAVAHPDRCGRGRGLELVCALELALLLQVFSQTAIAAINLLHFSFAQARPLLFLVINQHEILHANLSFFAICQVRRASPPKSTNDGKRFFANFASFCAQDVLSPEALPFPPSGSRWSSPWDGRLQQRLAPTACHPGTMRLSRTAERSRCEPTKAANPSL